MGAMSNYLEGQIVQHIFRTSSYTKPTVLAMALCTATPTDASTGATITEVANSGSYARVTLNPSNSNWADTSGTDATTSNSSAITFTQATGSWGTVTAVAICDSATWGAGNMLFYGALSASKTVGSGDTFTFAIGDLSVVIDS